MNKRLLLFISIFLVPGFYSTLYSQEHLLLTEATVTPSSSEFLEIFNPTGANVDLTNYYLSDDNDYALYPGTFGNGPAPVIDISDFIVQFPLGEVIAAGQIVVIAFDGAGFFGDFGFSADYEIRGTDPGTPDMIASNLGTSAGLTNGGENACLFYWDGLSDLVMDVDMIRIGTPSAANDIGNKTGVSVDGPDADVMTSTYLDDGFTMTQQPSAPGPGFSTKRIYLEDANEVNNGGNGITGHDETTEDILVTWDTIFEAPDPGMVSPGVLVDVEEQINIPVHPELSQNYPNPFNPTTTIRFTLTQSGNVTLKVYNTIGQQVAVLLNGYKEAGVHTINFNAKNLNTGIYIYKLVANGLVQSRKMMLVK